MSKRTWVFEVIKVIKRENQAIVLVMGRKCRKHWSVKFSQGPALLPLGVSVETNYCVSTVYQVYLVSNYLTFI
jgi:uncharacterized membrane protein HdeD (DUF308 family)